jgi:hypothetical protein
MADAFADLSQAERIEKAVKACKEDCILPAQKAAQIYQIAYTIITRRIKHVTRSKKTFNQSRQLLSPIKKQAIMK